ncbi:class I SAM-dependent methyltransferase [Myxococcus llanfairpwllgwyngyllgogerychwyrndrobwllllantysiliogogogochensis]|uniref:Class I SAM-dependent methyltransferase n=1 Tax=Myxococcus llanfairpwllgwyngyllgogerychwyrndrobwllllantysiliogogogochensis TaxID=2590453 RepID=A0A540X6M5_9BACT|nr:class I SAM-dependent methyltransferase [Myxococcus llanfairpwllgwyngyllgogerychwyrndrobwllllantysiliogogogochensis]TQF16913.1 class I SAM-dependent methyltransferase [Myxococcus llanfairpwllgwyngyllgogerychwyrndrobwllllantysiliogogogochensis]
MKLSSLLAKDGLQRLPARVRRRLALEARRLVSVGVAHVPPLRSGLELLSFELSLLLAQGSKDMYGASYYGAGRNPLDREGNSGYEHYRRDSSHANKAAYLLWNHFDVRTSLDVGCALGFTVQALRELGWDTQGSDFSDFAIHHAPWDVKPHLSLGDLSQRLPFDDGQFELVSAFETLEHLPPSMVPHAISELHRVTRGFLVVTAPSFGPCGTGPDGWFDGKVRPERLEHYRSLGPDYLGPVPEVDLARDEWGRPLEGHVTIASFAWWRRQFESAGFVLAPALEQRMYADIQALGLQGLWNLYVLHRPGVALPATDLRTPEEQARLARRWDVPLGAG